jgi:hypothetical protein
MVWLTTALALQLGLSLQRQAHVGDHFVLLHFRPYIDVVKEDRQVSEDLPTRGKPHLVKVNRCGVVRARTGLSCDRTAATRNDLIRNTLRIRRNVVIDGYAEVDAMINRGRCAGIRVVNSVAPILPEGSI